MIQFIKILVLGATIAEQTQVSHEGFPPEEMGLNLPVPDIYKVPENRGNQKCI